MSAVSIVLKSCTYFKDRLLGSKILQHGLSASLVGVCYTLVLCVLGLVHHPSPVPEP